jgi:hypothetical protein
MKVVDQKMDTGCVLIGKINFTLLENVKVKLL